MSGKQLTEPVDVVAQSNTVARNPEGSTCSRGLHARRLHGSSGRRVFHQLWELQLRTGFETQRYVVQFDDLLLRSVLSDAKRIVQFEVWDYGVVADENFGPQPVGRSRRRAIWIACTGAVGSQTVDCLVSTRGRVVDSRHRVLHRTWPSCRTSVITAALEGDGAEPRSHDSSSTIF